MAGIKSKKVDFFFNPSSIAVVGASPVPGKLSNVIMESLERSGFAGDIYPVNPNHGEVRGRRCYPSIRSIGVCVDVAVFSVPAPVTLPLLKEAGGSLRGAIIVSGGFSEIGNGGKELEEKLRQEALSSGIRVIGPNCMGLYDTVSRVDTLFIPQERVRRPKKGRIAMLSQSGSIALTAMDEFYSLGIGISRVVSYGNRMDVNEADCLDFLADDEQTDVIFLYIESIEDGRRFVESASRVSKKKTLMAWKVGKQKAGMEAARSHTGAIAGRYEVYRAAFKKAGIIEVSGYEEFLDACKAVSVFPRVRGNRVMIITDGGGVGVSIADECAFAGLDVAPLPREKKEALKTIFPPYFTVSNPLDLTGSATDEWFKEALLRTMEGDFYDIAIVAALWGPPKLTDRLAELLSSVAKSLKKPVIICSTGGEYAKAKKPLFENAGLPVFLTPESAVRAACALAERKDWKYGGR